MIALLILSDADRSGASEHQLDGYVSGFYSRNYGAYSILGPEIAVVGTGINSVIMGPVFERRLLRYSLGGSFSRGFSIGLAERVRLLDHNLIAQLTFFPYHWYSVSVFAETGSFQLKDGPQHSMQANSRGYGADLSIRPVRDLPSLYNSYSDRHFDIEYLGGRDEQRIRTHSARSVYHIGKNTSLDAAYDWSLSDYDQDSSLRNRRVYLQSFSRLSTDTSLSLMGSGNWLSADIARVGITKSQKVGMRSFFYQRVSTRDDYTVSHTTEIYRNDSFAVTDNNLQALWNHQYTYFLRFSGGGEFAQSVTEGGIFDLAYSKYREAAIAGTNLRLTGGYFEFTPSYFGRLGAVQVPGAVGGRFYGHSVAVPVAFTGFDSLPLSLAGFYNVEVDNSAIPSFYRYRSVNFRADTYSARSESGTFSTHVYLDAQRSRNDGKILHLRSRRDESRLGTQVSTMAHPFHMRFSTGYAFSRVETLDGEFDVHHIGASWNYAPTATLSFLNQVDWSRTVYPLGEEVDQTSFRSEAAYFLRKLEFAAAYRYDSYGRSGDSSWGLFFEVRRHFAIGI